MEGREGGDGGLIQLKVDTMQLEHLTSTVMQHSAAQ